MKNEIIERFTSYVKSIHSLTKTMKAALQPRSADINMLADELKSIGMTDITVDDNGYVMATLPANTDKDVPTVGFLAHVDTATDFTGKM